VKYNKSLTFNCSGIYICTPSETREILSADLLGTRSGTITSEDSTHKLYLVANSLQSGYNRSSIYIRLRKDIYPSKGDILNPRPTAIWWQRWDPVIKQDIFVRTNSTARSEWQVQEVELHHQWRDTRWTS
jgi:hypothetical protein